MLVKRYRFRDFLLVPAARELYRGDGLVALPASAFDCLVYLVVHRDRAVGRDELISAVWGRVDVADTLLAQTIMRVRRSIGDSGSDGAIRTVARFGYRWAEETLEENEALEAAPEWRPHARMEAAQVTDDPAAIDPAAGAADAAHPHVAHVEEDPASTTSASGGTAPAAAQAPASSRRRIAIFVAACVLAFSLLSIAKWWTTQPSGALPSPDTAPPTLPADIATAPALVLPAQVPDSPDWRWLRVGLMDLLGDRLRLGGVPTAPSETVLSMLGADVAPDAAQLRIEPHASVADGQWRIRLQLRRGSESASVEAAAPDVLQAARAAADLLLVRLGHVPPGGGDLPRPLALEQLLQQTRAAILADQFDLARHLIAQAPPELQDAPELALRLAQIEHGQGDEAGAEARLQQVLERVPAAQPALRGRMLSALGAVRFRRGQTAAADAAYAEAIALLDTARDPLALGAAYSGRAAVAAANDNPTAAAADLGRARAEMEAAGDAFGLAQVDMNLGLIEAGQYRPAQAVRMLEDAEARIARIGAREELAYVRYALVGQHLQLLDVAKAEATLASVWPPEAHTGNVHLRHELQLARATLLANTGKLTEAETILRNLMDDAGALTDVRSSASARLVQLLVARGQHEAALAHADSIDTAGLAAANPDLYVIHASTRAAAQRALGRIAEAAATAGALSAWVDAHPTAWRRLHATLVRAEAAWADAHDAASLAQLADAYTQAEALAVPEDLAAAGEPYALALIASGELDRASTVAGRLGAWADADLRAAWVQTQLYRAQARVDAWQAGTERVLRLAGERALPPPAID